MSLTTLNALPATPPQIVAAIEQAEAIIRTMPQIEVQTEHILHGGMYSRTVRLAPKVVITGVLIKVPTLLIISGKCRVFTGAGWFEMEGFNIIAASKGRKQVFVTHEETILTMIFKTDAKTVEEAENEFTDQGDLLMSRNAPNDLFLVTGE